MNPILNEPKTLKQIIASDILFFGHDSHYYEASRNSFEGVLAKLWVDLKADLSEDPLGLHVQMFKIEQIPANFKSSDRFKKLTPLFSSRFELAGIDLKGRIPLSCIQYKQLQEVQQLWDDESLSALWDAQGFAIQPGSIKAKRDWLEAETNAPFLAPIIELNLPVLELKTVPSQMIHFKNLRSLNLASNQLTVLPESLRSLTFLEGLMLNDNQLIAVPEFVGSLPLLTTAYFSRNRITHLPPECFAGCKALINIALSGNQIEGPLSKCFAKCVALTNLDLSGNQITTVPPGCFAGCFQLRIVDLNDNPVQLKNLKSLDEI